MRLRVLLAVAVVSQLAAQPSPLATAVVSRNAAVCVTATDHQPVVATPCSGASSQMLSLNFAVGGLQNGPSCLRRDGSNVTLAVCRAGDQAEVLQINSATFDISNNDGGRRCLAIKEGGTPREQPLVFAPCTGAPSQQWILGNVKSAAGSGTPHQPGAAGQLRSGDYVALGNGYLVIK